jgi:hypothetical protein
MLFEQKHFGKPISEKLSRILIDYTNNYDKLEATKGTNIGSVDTIKAIIGRARNLTEQNSEAIINLARIAFVKVGMEKERAEESEDYLLEELQESDFEIRNNVLNQTKHELV